MVYSTALSHSLYIVIFFLQVLGAILPLFFSVRSNIMPAYANLYVKYNLYTFDKFAHLC